MICHLRAPRLLALALAAAATGSAFVACGDPLGLPRASIPNIVDTVSLFALSGTPIASHSAYRLDIRQSLRTDQTNENQSFDFAFDIDTAGRALIYPSGALRLGRGSGAQLTTTPFDSILIAPNRNYQLDSAVEVQVASVVLVQSRPNLCTFGITASFFAKLRVLEIDTTSAPGGRRIDFQILVDQNCGYRGLEPGLPDR